MGLEAGKAVLKSSAQRYSFHVDTRDRVEFQDITGVVQKAITESAIASGTCHLFVPHTSAAILIQENDDPALQKDLDHFLARLAPRDQDYHHNDGNCDSHLKASLIGSSKTVFIENGRLLLGRWQGVFFCEFDGPRHREFHVKLIPD